MHIEDIDWELIKGQVLKKEKIDSQKKVLLVCLEECLKNAKSLVKPDIASTKKKIIQIKDDVIELEGETRLCGKSLASYISQASSVEIFLVTLGSQLEKTASKWMGKGKQLEGYLLDRIGSFAVESNHPLIVSAFLRQSRSVVLSTP